MASNDSGLRAFLSYVHTLLAWLKTLSSSCEGQASPAGAGPTRSRMNRVLRSDDDSTLESDSESSESDSSESIYGTTDGCGHNLIATGSIAAFLGMAAALRDSNTPGRVRLLGSPAEEGGAGKIRLIEADAFKGVDAAIMSHPFPISAQTAGLDGVAYGNCLAVCVFRAVFTGRSAHGAFSPWMGANAADAAALTYTAVGMLRQQTRPSDIIGLVIEDGGASSNVISQRAAINGNVRAKTLKESFELLQRVFKCVEGAAVATGCTVEMGET